MSGRPNALIQTLIVQGRSGLVFQRLFWGALAGGLIAAFFGDLPLVKTLELNMLNHRYKMADQITAAEPADSGVPARISKDIAIVAFDDHTQFDWGAARFSEPDAQARLARVLDVVEQGGPAIVAIDLNLKKTAHEDLVRLFRKYRNVVISIFGDLQDDADLPPVELLSHARAHGYHGLIREPSGLIIRLPLRPREPDPKGSTAVRVPSLTEAVVAAYNQVHGLGKEEAFGSITSDQPVYLSFRRMEYPVYSMSEVVQPSFDPSVFRDRIVLIGSTLTPRRPDGTDQILQPRTPVREPGPEILIHADSLSTILNRQIVFPFPDFIGRHILIVLGAVFSALFSVVPLGVRALYAVGGAALVVLAGQLSLLACHVALPVVAPLSMLGTGFIIGTVIYLDTHLRQRNKELAAARESMQVRAEVERKRIAEDLHDETLPALSSVARMIDELGEEHAESAVPARMRRKLDETIQEMRRVINDLHPSVLETMGFVPALENLAVMLERDTGIEYSFEDGTGSYDYPISDLAKLQLYRIVQEALNNVGKHSEADMVEVNIKPHGDTLEITITDNGRGINFNAIRPDAHGLINIKNRAQLVGAHVEWRKPRKFASGTELRLTIPMQHENGATPT